jgi:hypothetical protein
MDLVETAEQTCSSQPLLSLWLLSGVVPELGSELQDVALGPAGQERDAESIEFKARARCVRRTYKRLVARSRLVRGRFGDVNAQNSILDCCLIAAKKAQLLAMHLMLAETSSQNEQIW